MFGILNINKPAGKTSRDVVTHVSRLLGKKVKCGHAGTLDPLATGVLLVCVGKATKLVPWIHEHSKSYAGSFLLGQSSPTDDIEGDLTEVAIPAGLTGDSIRAVLPKFIGLIKQVPPAHSAVWVNGERAYKAARRGEEIEMPERTVQIDRLELTVFDSRSMTLSMTCGTGTYVRSIGRDLARELGTEATMNRLIRTSIGPFVLSDAIELKQLRRENLTKHLHSPVAVLDHLSQYVVDRSQEQILRFGRRIPFHPEQLLRECAGNSLVLTDSTARLVAIAEHIDREIAPQLVFPELSE